MKTNDVSSTGEDYMEIKCRVCEALIFSPGTPTGTEDSMLELTCSNGHTESYELRHARTSKRGRVRQARAFRSFAGMG